MRARHIVTGNEFHPKIMEGHLSASEFVDERYKLFVEERLVEGTVDFYKPMKSLFLPTGLAKSTSAESRYSDEARSAYIWNLVE